MNKGNFVVSSKSNDNSCLNNKSRQQTPFAKRTQKKRGLNKTRRVRQVAKSKKTQVVMPPSSKDYFKFENSISPAWPQPDMYERSFDMYIAPPAPLNSTEDIMDNYYEAERALNEVVSTPDRIYVDDVRPFNLNGSMFVLGSQVTSRCA
jgi:hypothetical protein